MQGATRNALAEPGILGVNAGAAFAVVLAISFLGVGSVAGYAGFALLGAGGCAALVLALGLAIALAAGRSLNALALGDDVARSLRAHVGRARVLATIGFVLLAGGAVAAVRPVAFVGLAVPHIARALVGHDYRWIVPYSALLGAALLLAGDVLGRIVARPHDLSVGIVTALLGAPLFVRLVRRRKLVAL